MGCNLAVYMELIILLLGGFSVNVQLIMTAIGLVLIIEGLGPLLFPNKWQKYLLELSTQKQNVLRRLGGSLVTAGIVLLIIF
jgi:uncharacterized protein YjeT (DUF2065 family)